MLESCLENCLNNSLERYYIIKMKVCKNHTSCRTYYECFKSLETGTLSLKIYLLSLLWPRFQARKQLSLFSHYPLSWKTTPNYSLSFRTLHHFFPTNPWSSMLDINFVTAARSWEFHRAGLAQESRERNREAALDLQQKVKWVGFLYLKCHGSTLLGYR